MSAGRPIEISRRVAFAVCAVALFAPSASCTREDDALVASEQARRTATELSRGLNLTNAVHAQGPLSASVASGPRLASYTFPAALTPGQEFEVRIAVAGGSPSASLGAALQVRDATEHLRLPLPQQSGFAMVHPEQFGQRHLIDVALVDETGQVGPRVTTSTQLLETPGVFDGSLRVLGAHKGFVEALAFASETGGDLLVTGGSDGLVTLWNVAVGQEAHRLQGHRAAVFAVALTSDALSMASGGDDQDVRFWDASSGDLVSVGSEHRGSVRALAVAPGDTWLASGSWDETVRIWNPRTGEHIASVALDGPVNDVEFSPDGQYLAAGVGRLAHPGSVAWIETTSWTVQREIDRTPQGEFAGEVTELSFSADATWIAVAHGRGHLDLFSAVEGTWVRQMRDVPSDTIEDTGFLTAAPDFLVGLGLGGRIIVWDTDSGAVVAQERVGNELFGLAIADDGRWLALGTLFGSVWVFEPPAVGDAP